MKIPKFISPSSYSWWFKNKEEYYMRYLAEVKPPKMKQTEPMAVGSAFDAFIKDCIAKIKGVEYDFESEFKRQIENPAYHDKMREYGKYLLECYRKSGALTDILLEIGERPIEFESTIQGIIEGVPLLGKPDAHVPKLILDFKVNGFFSKSGASPGKGYVKCRDGWDSKHLKHSNTNGKSHRDAMPILTMGSWVNVASPLETLNIDWANQMAIYSWLLGEKPGSDFVVGIEQLTCKRPVDLELPVIKVSTHRARVSSEHQLKLLDGLVEMWDTINSDHIFRTNPDGSPISKEESQKLCKHLDKKSRALVGDGTKEDEWFNEITRTQ